MSEVIDYCTGGIVLVAQGIELQKITVQGDLLSGANGDAADMAQSRAGVASHLRVYVVSHSGGPTIVRLVRSPGLQPVPGLEISFDDDASGLFENSSVQISFSAGDRLRYAVFRDDEGDATVLSYISVRIEFDE